VAVSTTKPGVQRIELVGNLGRIEIVGETLVYQRFEPSLSEHLPTCTEMFANRLGGYFMEARGVG
jgi:hypothetical protein